MAVKNQIPSLSGQEIHNQVVKRLEKYMCLNFFEQFAMFMGISQILEFGLKNVLSIKYGLDSGKMEKWPLGKTKDELKKRGLRADFIQLLESVVGYRNYIAHELLANKIVMEGLTKDFSGRFEFRELQHGIYDLERITLLFDWCQENNSWD